MSKLASACLIGAGAIVTLIITGCAGPEVAAPGQPKVVMTCPSQGLEEMWARHRLKKADGRAREDIEKAREVAEAASGRFGAAKARLEAKDLPEGETRPTKEEVEALLKEAKDRWWDWWKAINDQIDRYDQFLQKHPENWHVRHRFAWFLADMNLRYEAADEWERVIEQEPNFPYAYNNLGSLYNHMGRDKESIQLFRKAISMVNDDPVFWINLAVNYSTHRKETMDLYGWDLPRTFRECMNAYRRALALDPKNVSIARDMASQYVLAKHFKVTGWADDALKDWDYYLGLDLNDNQRIFGYMNVGRIHLTQKNDPRTAIEWLKKAEAIDEHQPSIKALLKMADDALKKKP